MDIPDSHIKNVSNVIVSSYYRCKGLGWAVKMTKPDRVIVLDMIEYVPFLPLFVPSSVKVSGIIYRIYLYEWESESFFMKVQDWLKYKIFSRFKVYDRVYMLNDSNAAITLNDKYGTSKFRYLADPVAVIRNPEHLSIRQKYNISKDKVILLHPGGLLPYKGTIEILRALSLLNNKNANKIVVVFAGRVTESIKEEFFLLYRKVEKKVQVVLDEGFLPFEKLGGYFAECDWVLMPYKIKSQSSGVIGHAAYFKKPVIAIKGGLIGNIVKKYNLGILVNDASPSSLVKALEGLPYFDNSKNKYVEEHTVEGFCEKILNE